MNGRLDSKSDEDPANHESNNQKSKGGKQMNNQTLRVRFDLPEDLYEELMELENGKYRDPSQLEVDFFDLKSLNSSHVS